MLKWWKRKKKKQEKCEEVFVGAIVKIRGLPNKFMVMRKLSNKWCVLVNIDNHCDERTVNIGYIKLVKAKEEINMGNNKHNFVVGDWVYTPIEPCKAIHTTPQEIEDIQGEYAKICGEWFELDKLKHAFKNGDEVEVSDDGIQWNKALFVGVNPKITNYRYVVVTERNFSTSSWINIRPVQPKPTTIDIKIGDSVIAFDIDKAIRDAINKKLEEIK